MSHRMSKQLKTLKKIYILTAPKLIKNVINNYPNDNEASNQKVMVATGHHLQQELQISDDC